MLGIWLLILIVYTAVSLSLPRGSASLLTFWQPGAVCRAAAGERRLAAKRRNAALAKKSLLDAHCPELHTLDVRLFQ